jgi:hypothetical protein
MKLTVVYDILGNIIAATSAEEPTPESLEAGLILELVPKNDQRVAELEVPREYAESPVEEVFKRLPALRVEVESGRPCLIAR